MWDVDAIQIFCNGRRRNVKNFRDASDGIYEIGMQKERKINRSQMLGLSEYEYK